MNELNKQTARICASCACFHDAIHPFDPSQKMPVCRRNPPMAAEVQGERPQLVNGVPRTGKDGKIVMERVTKQMCVYPPMSQEMTCFDGWRPIGVLPGQRYDEIATSYIEMMKTLLDDMAKVGGTMKSDKVSGTH